MTDDNLGHGGGARGGLAARIRLPGWYVALWALAALALTSLGLLNRYLDSGTVNLTVLLPAIVVLLSFELVLRFTTGVTPSRRTLLAYPSTRLPGALMVLAVVGGEIVTMLVARANPPLAVVIAVSTAVLGTHFLLRMTAGIRRDVREGRAQRA